MGTTRRTPEELARHREEVIKAHEAKAAAARRRHARSIDQSIGDLEALSKDLRLWAQCDGLEERGDSLRAVADIIDAEAMRRVERALENRP